MSSTALGRIMCLDLSNNTGWCIGTPDGIERSGLLRLKVGEYDDPCRPARRLAAWLRQQFMFEKYDLIVREKAMPPGAQMHAMKNSADTLAGTWLEIGALEAIAFCYGCRIVDVPVTTHRKFVTGQAKWETRKEAKRQSIAGVKRLGLWPANQKDDDNIADAIALFAYSVSAFGNKHLGEFALQGAAR
jgi:hypothetical protein